MDCVTKKNRFFCSDFCLFIFQKKATPVLEVNYSKIILVFQLLYIINIYAKTPHLGMQLFYQSALKKSPIL